MLSYRYDSKTQTTALFPHHLLCSSSSYYRRKMGDTTNYSPREHYVALAFTLFIAFFLVIYYLMFFDKSYGRCETQGCQAKLAYMDPEVG